MVEQIFFAEEVQDVIEDGEEFKPLPNPDSPVTQRRARDISLATGQPKDTVVERLSVGDTNVEFEAKGSALASAKTVEAQLDDDLKEFIELDQMKARFSDRARKQNNFTSVGNYYLEQALMLDDPQYTAEISNYVANQRILNDVFTQGIEEANGNLVWDIVDFIDYAIFTYPFRSVEDLTGFTTRRGDEVLRNSLTMNQDEFLDYAEGLKDEASREGLFLSDNLFALMNNFEAAKSAGYDPNDDLKKALAILDIGGLSAALTPSISSAARSTSALTSISSLKGPQAANATATRIVNDIGLTGSRTDDSTLAANLNASANTIDQFDRRPSQGPIMQALADNEVIQELRRMSDSGATGRVIDEAEIQAQAQEISKGIGDRLNQGILNYNVKYQDTNTFVVETYVGRNEVGLPFLELEDAEKVRRKIDGSRVEDRGDGYVVVVESRIDTTNLPKGGTVSTEDLPYNFVQNAFNSIFGSSGTRETSYLTSQAFLGEQAIGAIRERIWTPAQKKFQKISSTEFKNLDTLLKEFRDGAQAQRRLKPTNAEVTSRYTVMFGSPPSREVLEAWDAAVALSDASWWVSALRKLENTTRTGHTMINTAKDTYRRAYRVTKGQATKDIGSTAGVFDVGTGQGIRVADVPDGQVIYKSASIEAGDYLYYTGVKKTRIIEPDDVHSYNFGGPRTNPRARFFVGAVGETTDAAGNVVNDRYKAAFSAFSERDAIKGAKELNTIGRILREALDDTKVANWVDLVGNKNWRKKIDDVIKANNTWNTYITNLDDLVALSRKTNVNFTNTNFYSRARNAPVTAGEAGLDNSITTFDDLLEYKGSGPRMDEVLLEFGGNRTYTPDPLEAISKQFSGASLGFANKAYTYRSMAGWVEAAKRSSNVRGPDGVSPDEIFRWFNGAEVRNLSSVEGRRLWEQQRIIKRRLNLHDRTGILNMLGNALTEAVYGSALRKVFGQTDFANLGASDQLLKIGFFTKMGFWNFGQFIVQAMQMPVIMVMSPQLGPKGAAMALNMRTLSALSPAAEKLAFERMSKYFGFPVKEVEEMYKYLKDSGRLVVDVEAAELQTGLEYSAGRGVGALVGKFLNKSAGPFREGERIGRLTSQITALLEFKNKFPDRSINSDFGRAWITQRDQDLSFRMTSTSRSLGQDGFLRVPTQWMTYTFRSLETLFTGKQFTPAERARAFIPLVAMYGAAGLGLQSQAGYIAETLGINPDEEDVFKFRMVKYGIIDALLGDISFAPRVAPGYQLVETFRKVMEGSVLEAVYGPSGGITSDTFEPVYRGVNAALNGHWDIALIDWGTALKSVSSINNSDIAIEILRNGTYTTRSGRPLEGDFDALDAVAQSLGFPPEELVRLYEEKSRIYRSDKEFRDISKQLETLYMNGLKKTTEKDPLLRKEGMRILHSVGALIDHSSLSEQQKNQLRRSLYSVTISEWPQIAKKLIELGYEFESLSFTTLNREKGNN